LITKTCKILSILMIKSTEVPDEDVQKFFNWLIKQLRSKSAYLELSNALLTIQTLLRRDHFRVLFYREDGLGAINNILCSQMNNFQLLYQATYCCWLMSFNSDIAKNFCNAGTFLHKIVEIVRTIAKEKVVRMALSALRNVVDKSVGNNEQMIETNLLREVEKLLGKKWADEDIVADLEVLRDALQKNVLELTSFDKYKQELFSGELQWSPVHRSEKFWRENSVRFEENQNRPLMVLLQLLNKELPPLTLSVAAFDVGEFIRFHPRGRILITQYGFKEKVMDLMSHSDAEVQKNSLLCLQKLMVHNWEYISR